MKHVPTAQSCRISEIFSSLQGEGTHLGEKHIFIRFEECHIHCTYCDEDKPGRLMTLEETLDAVRRLEKEEGPHSFISLTGGEPLLYVTFLKPLAEALSKEGFQIYLETNGILTKPLRDLLPYCGCIAMDMKPASVTGEKNFYDEHRAFLEIAKAKETFVKLVISKQLKLEEFDLLMDIVRDVAPETPVILQPVSAEVEGHEDAELMRLLGELQRRGASKKLNMRIVPRFHRILKIR